MLGKYPRAHITARRADRQRDRLRAKLLQIDASLKKRPQKPDPVERRIGKWLGRNTAAESTNPSRRTTVSPCSSRTCAARSLSR